MLCTKGFDFLEGILELHRQGPTGLYRGKWTIASSWALWGMKHSVKVRNSFASEEVMKERKFGSPCRNITSHGFHDCKIHGFLVQVTGEGSTWK